MHNIPLIFWYWTFSTPLSISFFSFLLIAFNLDVISHPKFVEGHYEVRNNVIQRDTQAIVSPFKSKTQRIPPPVDHHVPGPGAYSPHQTPALEKTTIQPWVNTQTFVALGLCSLVSLDCLIMKILLTVFQEGVLFSVISASSHCSQVPSLTRPLEVLHEEL